MFSSGSNFTYIVIRSSELVGSGRWKWFSNEQKNVEKGEREKKGGKEERRGGKREGEGKEEKKRKKEKGEEERR